MHIAADEHPRFLARCDIRGVGVRRGPHREVGLAAGARVGGRLVREPQMVVVDVAQQHSVNLAEPWVVRATDREPRVIQYPRAVGILEDHGAVDGAKLAVVAAQGGDFYGARSGRAFLHAGTSNQQRCYCQTNSQSCHGFSPVET